MKIGAQVTNPGELRTEISLQTRGTVQDAGGFMVPGWTTIATVWARWINIHGKKILEAQLAKVEVSATVRIRYRSDIDTTWAVLKGSIRYEIISDIDNIQEKNEYMEFMVKRMKAG